MLIKSRRRYFLLILLLICLVYTLFNVSDLDVQSPASHTSQSSNPSTTLAPCPNNVNLSRQNQLLTIGHIGQLGNNMFQYAGLLGVARMNNRTPFISPRSILVNVFHITHAKSVPNLNKWKVVNEAKYGIYDSQFECLPRGPLRLSCYFQSYKYFQDIYPVIRKEFTFQPNINREALHMMKQLLVGHKNITTVGVHVRRGDKLSQKEISHGERVPPVSYFYKAFNWMRKKYTDVIFLVTSDDPWWVKAKLKGPDVRIVPTAKGPVHLSLLTQCDHVIMSVGTFGWWAGWLSGGDVIYFNQSLKPGSWNGNRFESEDFFPKHWTGLGA